MQLIYDSDAFVVVHLDPNSEVPGAPPRHGFEIVDKRANLEVYLDGLWAESFRRQIEAWQANPTTHEGVDEVLRSYANLAQVPLVMH